MYTASTALLEALHEAGVSYIFANLGSDHPAIIEAVAEAKATGRRVPTLVTCPNEMVALSAAQGYAQISGQAQAVFVHVECGTQALAGAVHNVAKARVPVFIFAGASPFTQEGELRGSRNEFIHWIQDVHDQRGILRGYVKYSNEFRSGRNVKQIVHRALQFANSDPKGPVYLVGAREVMEEEVSPVAIDIGHWRAVEPGALTAEGVRTIADDLLAAKRPLVVTSYLGRRPEAVAELVRLCEKLSIGVLESAPSAFNFPTTHPLHQGNQWTPAKQHPALAEADVVLVLDSDVPWVPLVSRPSDHAKIIHIDLDPLKEQMPVWYIRAAHTFRADTLVALRQINEHLEAVVCESAVEERRSHHMQTYEARRAQLDRQEMPAAGPISAAALTACIRKHLPDDSIVLNEGVTNYQTILDHLRLSRPGSMFTSGGGSLGWSGGAAVGAKLPRPDSTIVSLVGDGSFLFSVPSTVFWLARRYDTPFLQVVYNNGGWKAPKMSALAVHPDGYASRAEDIGVGFAQPPDYAAIATAAGGAFGRTVRHVDEMDAAVREALDVVRRERRCAVLDVYLQPL
jgi:acetolactate synthase-1/2/3 large subunit